VFDPVVTVVFNAGISVLVDRALPVRVIGARGCGLSNNGNGKSRPCSRGQQQKKWQATLTEKIRSIASQSPSSY